MPLLFTALGATSTIDIYKRLIGEEKNYKRDIYLSKMLTIFWGIIGVIFALFTNKLGNLIQAVNILGSLFYGSILGIFLIDFFIKQIRGTEVFHSAILVQIVVFLCFFYSDISFLWFNVIGSILVVGMSVIIHVFISIPKKKLPT
jgi:Na+(H+)/acetate symporter ActP